MKAILLAAGYGTRLQPLTFTTPKPMVPIANRPLIGWAIDALLHAGVRDIVINLHYLPESIERYVTTSFDANFRFSFEPEILGSGGGIANVRSFFEGDDDFFAANADTLQFPRYDGLARARRERDAIAALLLRHPPRGDRYTGVALDDGRITSFGNGDLMFSGAQCISSRIFRYLPDGASGIVDEVYKPLLRDGRETLAGVVDDNDFWFDIGTSRRLITACHDVLDATLRGAVAVVAGSHIDGDSIVADDARGQATHSTIGARSIIDGDVRDSVVWDDCVIARGVTLDNCIVGHGVTLDSGAFRNAVLCVDAEGRLVNAAG